MMASTQQESKLKEFYELPESFPHRAPKGYKYEVLPHKLGIIAVWTVHLTGFVFNDHSPHYCIWGFYDTKRKCYYAPINSTKQGDKVDLKDTTPYSAMPIKLSPLEMFMV